MERRYDDDFIPFSLFWRMRMMMRMMMERGNNLVDDPLSRERCFFFFGDSVVKTSTRLDS